MCAVNGLRALPTLLLGVLLFDWDWAVLLVRDAKQQVLASTPALPVLIR